MFRRIIEWNRARKRWNAEHESAWSQVRETDESGLTVFQRKAESVIRSVLNSSNLELRERKVEGENERFVAAMVPELRLRLWIYEDQTEIQCPGHSLRLEWWDTKTPEEHLAIVEKRLKSIVASCKGAA